MGCDIHMVLEKKFGERWVGLHDFSYLPASALQIDLDSKKGYSWIGWAITGRHYEFFWQLAGVRGGLGLEGKERGLPPDISELAHYRLSPELDLGLHSHSWNTMRELAVILGRAKHDLEVDPDAKPVTAKAATVAASLGVESARSIISKWVIEIYDESELDDLRVVYAFDN